MTSIQLWIAAGVLFYMAAMVAVGVWTSRLIKNTTDYIVAGRRLPWWLATGTIFATWFGAETCMGSAQTAYEKGLLGVIADPFGAGLCLIIAGFFFAKFLYNLKIETVTDFLELRYGKLAAGVLSIFIIPCYIGWVGAQLVAFGTIIHALTGLPILPSILISTAVVLFYTYSGGMWADTVTDFLQMVIILLGFFIMIPYIYLHLGSLPQAHQRIGTEFFHLYPHTSSALDWLNYLQAWIIVGLGSLSGQDLFSRILAAKNSQTAQWSSVGGGVMYWTIGLIPVLLGIYGRLLLPNFKGESILISLITQYLPAPVVALMVGALLSAIMSSADSALLAPASIVGHNLVCYIKPDISEEMKLKWCKWGVPLTGIASLALALYFQNIYRLCLEAWTFLLTGVTPAVIFGVYWKRANALGVLVGSVAGTISWIALSLALGSQYPTKLIGFLISCAITVLVSSLSPAQKTKVVWQLRPQKIN